MKAFAQHLTGLIRVGPDAEKYGDPWEKICAYASVDGETVVLMGVASGDNTLTVAHVRAAVQVALDMGFKRVVWDRKNHNNIRQIVAKAA